MSGAGSSDTPKPTTAVGHRRGILDRPRTLFLGEWSQDELDAMRPLVGFSRDYGSLLEAMHEVPRDEVDLIIVSHPTTWGHDHEWPEWAQDKFVAYFATASAGELEFPYHAPPVRRLCRHKEYEVSSEATELAALARLSTSRMDDAVGLPYWERPEQYKLRKLPIEHWLVRTDEGPCAFYSGNNDEFVTEGLLVVPLQLCQTISPAKWVASALRLWATLRPEVFPRVKTWRDETAWWTDEQRRLESELAKAQTQFDLARQAFIQVQAHLARQISEEAMRADASERRLLLSQGSELTEAASAAFERLGFTVTAPPEETTAAKAEDLILSRGEWLDWRASVEIKGFGTSSAKMIDATKLSNRRNRRMTGQAILVVNGEFSRAPSARHAPFEGNEESRDNLRELGVLVVDSRDLYRSLWDEQLKDRLIRALHSESGVYSDVEPL